MNPSQRDAAILRLEFATRELQERIEAIEKLITKSPKDKKTANVQKDRAKKIRGGVLP